MTTNEDPSYAYMAPEYDTCPDCEHDMALMPNGKEVFCPECEGHIFPLDEWKAKGWKCLENIVIFYKFSRKKCPSCGESTDFVDVTGKARDGYMLCRCSTCTRWWAEPEDGHPDHSF